MRERCGVCLHRHGNIGRAAGRHRHLRGRDSEADARHIGHRLICRVIAGCGCALVDHAYVLHGGLVPSTSTAPNDTPTDLHRRRCRQPPSPRAHQPASCGCCRRAAVPLRSDAGSSSERTGADAVFITSALSSSTVQFGWIWRSRAIAPATCGVAIEVPFDAPLVPVSAEHISREDRYRPGAAMSGLSAEVPLAGPREVEVETLST